VGSQDRHDVCCSDKGTPGDQKGADGVEIRLRAELSFTAPTEYKSVKLSPHVTASQNVMCTNSIQSRISENLAEK